MALLTLGDPATLTGGYLYHLRLAERAAAHDAEVCFLSFPDRRFPLPMLAGRAITDRAAGADVVVLDSIAAWCTAPWRTEPPLVVMAHQPPGGIDHRAPRATVQAHFDLVAYRRARKILVASESLAEAFRGLGKDVAVLPPGRDVAVPAQHAGDLSATQGVALLCVGNWVARKGITELLDAVAALPPGLATLHLVGRTDVDRPYTARVRERLGRPELRERVVIHGPVPKEVVAAMYQTADAFVLPSVREPYGTVYAEAMAAGLPVTGWDAGNLPFLARNEIEGLIVRRGDVDALAGALRRLAEDPGLRKDLGRAARARAESFPTWDETADRFFGHLRHAIG